MTGLLVISAEADITWKSVKDRSGKINKLHAMGCKFSIG